MAALAGKFAGEIDGEALAAVLAEGPDPTVCGNVLG